MAGEKEEQPQIQGISWNFYSASEGEVETDGSTEGEEAVTADAAAEANFSFGSTKGIYRAVAEEEEEGIYRAVAEEEEEEVSDDEEQVSDDDQTGGESVGSNPTPPSEEQVSDDDQTGGESVDSNLTPSDGWPSEPEEMGDLMLQFNNLGLSEEESEDDEPLEEVQGEEEDHEEEDDEDVETCAICKCPLPVRETRLRCSHIYHTHCIREWARYGNTCPVCRSELVIEDPADEE